MGNSIIKLSGKSGYSGYGLGISGYSGFSGTGASGYSGYSGAGTSGYSGYSGTGTSGYSGYSGTGTSGYSGYSGTGTSGYSGTGTSGYSGYSGTGTSGYSGYSGTATAWSTWSPTLTWTGGPPTVSNAVYRYTTIGLTVFFVIYFRAVLALGTATAVNITLPTYPKDIDAFIPVSAKKQIGSAVTEIGSVYINANISTAKLYISGLSVQSTTNTIFIEGFYEISS